jgi:hypothetical protein
MSEQSPIEVRILKTMSLAEIIEKTGAKVVFEQNLAELWSAEFRSYCGEPLLYQGHLRAGAVPDCFKGIQRSGRFASSFCATRDLALAELTRMLSGLECATFPNPPRGWWDVFRERYVVLDLRRTRVSITEEEAESYARRLTSSSP